jgi:hypothetical protein
MLDLLTALWNTSNYNATADAHTLQFTTAAAKPFPVWCAFNSRFLATASNSRDSSASCAQVLSSQSPLQNSRLPTLNSPSISLSAGLGYSLYILGADPTENTVSNNSSIVIVGGYLSTIDMFIRFLWNVFTE